MDNNKPSGIKLSGLRTFSKDQENKNSKTTTPSTSAEAIKNPEIKEQKKVILSEHDFKIHHPKKEIEEDFKPAVTTRAVPLPPPPPPPLPTTKKTDKVTISTDNAEADSATIITDTKKDRFKFFPAIFESISNWIEKVKVDRQAKKAPKYTVPETSRRKGVIQKATSLTGKITSSDHDTIQERIRQRQANEHKENDEDDHITWTPNTEPGYLLLEKEPSRISNVQVEQRKSFFTTEQDIVVKNLESLKSVKDKGRAYVSEDDSASRWENTKSNDEVTIPEPIPKTIIDTKPEPKIIPVPPLEKTSPIITETTSKQSVFESISEEHVVPETIKIPISPVVVAETAPLPPVTEEPEIIKEPYRETEGELSNQDKGFLLSRNTNTLAFSTFSIILIVLIIVGFGYYWSNNNETGTSPVVIDYPKVINGDISFVYQPITNKYDLVSKITSEFGGSKSEAYQFIFTTTPEGTVAVDPDILLTHLDIKLNANFSQSINTIYFGQLHHTSPFISFVIADTETAKGGMLIWEKTMRSEIYPILKLPSLESSSTSSIKFIDAMISGVDVRVLKGVNGEEEIIYGFANPNTIIITTNSKNFGESLQLLIK